MGIARLVFVLVAVPVFFFVFVWAAASAYRLLFPEKPLPLERDPVAERRKAAASGKDVLVGVREIREDRRHHPAAHAHAPYDYHAGHSGGLPEGWIDDLWQRRN